MVARITGLKYQQVRVMMIEFLNTDVFHVTAENCVSFLDPLIESWDIDLETLGIEIILNRDLVREYRKRFDFIEREPQRPKGGRLRSTTIGSCRAIGIPSTSALQPNRRRRLKGSAANDRRNLANSVWGNRLDERLYA
jgi:hypothetical protein